MPFFHVCCFKYIYKRNISNAKLRYTGPEASILQGTMHTISRVPLLQLKLKF